ncbi:FKBP-type peptidyl-prolyl cis-trans isomerase [Pontibacter silvestris]|uniref:Peptidyl-prolyl cis-trans isomerase n=1 Tax=Pontibacter silvestris TaxID=2305183 RepID=A0ABW4X4J5_9BACT|nr:FKBP-type peptidyl-prolyl cis-trans isomerase [Pontibacter silvestris]
MTLQSLIPQLAKSSHLLKALLFLAVAVSFVSCSSDSDPYAGYYYPTNEELEQQKIYDDQVIHQYFKDSYQFFVDNNVDTTDVVKTSTGLYYLKLEEGTGNMVVAGNSVDVHYVGKRITSENGKVVANQKFDSSYDRGEAFNVVVGAGQVIKGWDEGLQLMHEGERGVLFIPSHLGYGYSGSGTIPPYAVLAFDVEVLDIK